MGQQQRHSIEHPEQLGKENKHILDHLSDAYFVADDLAKRGFVVLKVEIGQDNPRVHIRRTGMCKRLNATWRVSKRTEQGCSRLMCAKIKGVQVEWEETFTY